MSTNRFSIVVGLACVLATCSPTVTACEKKIDGGQFLTRVHDSGMKPTSSCFETNLLENHIFAFPDKSCTVEFSVENWSMQGWTFKALTGLGSFKVDNLKSRVSITIEEGGGFMLKDITLERDFDGCDDIELKQIF